MKVSHSNKNPILFLPDRSANSDIPTGWQQVDCDGRELYFKFAKVAVNVASEEESGSNILASVIRGWFGPDAGLPGLPGTNFQAGCEFVDGKWVVKPILRK